MSPEEEIILKLSQQIYLTQNGVYNDVEDEELEAFLDMTIDWVNTFYPELEVEADWSWLRTNDNFIYEIDSSAPNIFLNPTIQRLASSQLRDLTIRNSDGGMISAWSLVSPNQVYNPQATDNPNRVTVVGRKLVFSRAFYPEEIGCVLYADTIGYIPQLTRTNIESLDLVRPQQLIVLGVSKNQILPDVVNGALSPNYSQKYAALLKRAKETDGQTSHNSVIDTSFDYIRGVM